MVTNGNLSADREAYIRAWAQMMITIWMDKMAQFGIGDTGALLASLDEQIAMQSGGDAAKITHIFNEYGIYVERGTGREISKENGGDLGFTPNRKKKPWLSKKYFSSVMVILDKMAEMYGEEFHVLMQKTLGDYNFYENMR